MSWFSLFIDLKRTTHELRRIADALERAFPPPPPEPPPDTTPPEVSYVDEEELARREMAEELRRLADYDRIHEGREAEGDDDTTEDERERVQHESD